MGTLEPDSEAINCDDFTMGTVTFDDEKMTLSVELFDFYQGYALEERDFPSQTLLGWRLCAGGPVFIHYPECRESRGVVPSDVQSGADGSDRKTRGRQRSWRVGSIRGYYYPVEKALLVRTCHLDRDFRLTNPVEDPNQDVLWRGFEVALLECCYFRHVSVETCYALKDPVYAMPVWQKFLELHGYRRVAADLFEKIIPPIIVSPTTD